MPAGWFTLLLLIPLLQARDPRDAGAAEQAPRRPPFEFRTFGEDTLKRSQVVAEGRATSVIPAGRGVSVAHFEVLEKLRGKTAGKELVVLAAPGQFNVGVTYLLFLDRFLPSGPSGPSGKSREGGESGRLTVVNRIASGERDYAAKLQVLKEFLEADAIAAADERALRIRGILLKNLGDSNLFIKWNALTELGPFVHRYPALFGPREKARMVEVYRGDASPSFRRHLREILTRLGIRFEK